MEQDMVKKQEKNESQPVLVISERFSVFYSEIAHLEF